MSTDRVRALYVSLLLLPLSLGEAAPASARPTGAGTSERGRRSRPAQKSPPITVPPPSEAPPPAPARSVEVIDLAKVTPQDLLARAHQLYRGLEYDLVIPVARALLERPGVDVELRMDAYLLEGSALAIIGDPIDAEKPFRFLLRGRPDFDLPPETPPKILAVFRKVQVEERAILEQTRELERKRLVRELEISGELPNQIQGGRPLELEYRVRDPRGVVKELNLGYRRAGDTGYSLLALARDDSGTWRGSLPGEWTSTPEGFGLEYYLLTADRSGSPLLELGSPAQPLAVPVLPGEVEEGGSFFGSVWFWVIVATAAAASGTAGYLIYRQSSELPPSDLGPVQLR